MYKLAFKDGIAKYATMGNRRVPRNAQTITHPDGTTIYIVTATNERMATEQIVLQSKFDQSKVSAPYLHYAYTQEILDMENPDMFMLVLFEYDEWHKQILY